MRPSTASEVLVPFSEMQLFSPLLGSWGSAAVVVSFYSIFQSWFRSRTRAGPLSIHLQSGGSGAWYLSESPPAPCIRTDAAPLSSHQSSFRIPPLAVLNVVCMTEFNFLSFFFFGKNYHNPLVSSLPFSASREVWPGVVWRWTYSVGSESRAV